MFIWCGGVVSRGVVGLDLAVGGIDDGGFGKSSRHGESVSVAAMAAVDLVYLFAAKWFGWRVHLDVIASTSNWIWKDGRWWYRQPGIWSAVA